MDFQGDVFGYWGRNIIEKYDDALLKLIGPLTATALEETSQLPELSQDGYDPMPGTVGILGAGVGGLYTALILDSLNIKYEILEASDHTGGRLLTYNFPNGGKYDYYDVGAMRFPLPKKDAQGNYKIGIMRRLGELINYPKLNTTPRLPSTLDLFKAPLKSKLIDYHFTSKRQGYFLYFNTQRYRVPQTPSRPPDFHARDMGVDSQYIAAGVENIVEDVIGPFAKDIIKDIEQNVHSGWDNMLKHDAYSLRSFMSFKYIPSASLQIPPTHLSTNVINWCETFENSTGSYDRALTESVLEALAFASVESQTFGDVEWKCFEGGSQVLTDYMAAYITSTANDTKPLIQFNKKVTSISRSGAAMNVSVRGESSPRTYSHVISTIPLPCLRVIELENAGLNVMQTNALRKLQYGPSIKIGMRFRSAWWTTLGIIGGQSSTDLPIRTIVYPSHGAESSTPSTVLIASYCWTNDAERLGALINTGKKEYEEQLKELVLRNLAQVHGEQANYDFLLGQYVDMHAWDWSDDPLVMGAFAFFGPGDFQDLYTSLTAPNANKRLHFAGEAISTRHAWVVGALDSAWRAVYEYLLSSRQHDKIQRFFDLWGQNEEWSGRSKYRILPGDHGPVDLDNTILRAHMGYTYAGELAGEVKF
ncbi:hypothetical protein DFJ58DRAFT_63493 [Suillus subalutaceus]|uniref:uncharacterized protein n=1 Tax=Suillus subalutaceus TaxID=48586 RepID=UPI001B87F1CD|nr:uncharacterized protein DFJ58DRAFT_63493 [Suillus subalutaceus]KAG1869407.1 hypothetical protein DFJ58DRAFT_63493 [Suillus subalutaceus]